MQLSAVVILAALAGTAFCDSKNRDGALVYLNRLKREETTTTVTTSPSTVPESNATTPIATTTLSSKSLDASSRSPDQKTEETTGTTQGQSPETTSTTPAPGRRAAYQARSDRRPLFPDQGIPARTATQSIGLERGPGHPNVPRPAQRAFRKATIAPVRRPDQGGNRYPHPIPRPQPGYDAREADRYPASPRTNNIALEMELLRFSNERGVTADNRPCGSGEMCGYDISTSLEVGNAGPGERELKSDVLTTRPKSESVDILMRSMKTFCNFRNSRPQATLRVEIKTADPARPRYSRQIVRETPVPVPHSEDDLTAGSVPSSTSDDHDQQPSYGSDGDALNRVEQPNQYIPAEDQYSRDRYAVDQPSPQQGRGTASNGDRNRAFRRTTPRPIAGRPLAPAGPGQLVNVFDCIINLSNAERQEAHNSQWQTTNCKAQYFNAPMELIFRYNAYSVDSTECARSDGPLTWTPMNLFPVPGQF